ncbi:MAG: molybdopterin molybdotransferase MoeA [Cyanobium sp.]
MSAEPFPAEGLPLEEARAQVLAAIQPLAGQEVLPLERALGRVAAAPVQAPEAIPGFAASIMDGYAVADIPAVAASENGQSLTGRVLAAGAAAEAAAGAPSPAASATRPLPPPIGCRWRLVGRAAPAAPWDAPLQPGEAVRILTGAPVPAGCRRVLPQELVQVAGDQLELVREAGANPWIRAADEEAAAGQRLLQAGCRLGPAELARLAGCGIAALAVRSRPRLGLLISGDELTPVGEPRRPGAIWESNGTLLQALLQRLGVAVAERRLVADQPEALRAALQELASRCDVVVSTGGVSAGDADWIRPLVQELGEVAFWKLYLRPGRPFAFGELLAGGAPPAASARGGDASPTAAPPQQGAAGRRVPFFGLPGNPVAAAITALQLLWPALQRLEGAEPQLFPRLRVQLAQAVKRSPGRPELARARLEVAADGTLLARLEGSQASSRIGSLQGADLLLEIPAELGALEAGTSLWAQLLRLPLL